MAPAPMPQLLAVWHPVVGRSLVGSPGDVGVADRVAVAVHRRAVEARQVPSSLIVDIDGRNSRSSQASQYFVGAPPTECRPVLGTMFTVAPGAKESYHIAWLDL